MDDKDIKLTMDEVKMWTVDALEDFLRKRNMKISKRKEELVALVFAAMHLPGLAGPSTSRATAELQKKGRGRSRMPRRHVYEDLLKTSEGDLLPDPQQLSNWESEESSITKWPPTMSLDISSYLHNVGDEPLQKRLQADYKDRKAYKYFAPGQMEEIEYHSIDDNSEFCFLRTKCRPSQRTKKCTLSVWVAVKKKSGEVLSGFCQCFAGYNSTCDHVAGLLFKMDFAWENGLTNAARTSGLSSGAQECNMSAFADTVEPMRIEDLPWCKRQRARQAAFEKKMRRRFSPLADNSTEEEPTLESLNRALPSFKDSCVFMYLNDPRLKAAGLNKT